ncbi:MAG: hypothetical protein SGARI_002230 [Bacillariaceae sp.]
MDILAAVVGAASKTEAKEDTKVDAKSKSSEDGKEEEPPIKVIIPTAAASTEAAKVEEEDSVMKDPEKKVTATEEHDEDSATHGTAEEEGTVGEDSKASDAPPASKESAKKVTAVKAKKPRRKKSRKPAGYPKRPLSAYNIFFKDTREKIIEEHGKTNFQDMVRLIAAAWKEATAEEKKKYEALAAKDLIRYKDQVGVFEREAAERKRIEDEKRADMERKKRETELKFINAQQQRSAESASGVRLGADALSDRMRMREEAMLAAMQGGAMSGGANPRELELARLRLEQDLRGVEEARALRLRQMEIAQLQGGAGGMSAMMAGLRGPGAGMFGGPGLGELEMELQRRMMAQAGGGGGGDPLAMANELELRHRLAMMRNPAEQAMMEEQEKLLREGGLGAHLSALGGRFGALGGMPGMGMGNPYEEALLREQMLRREREALLLGGGGAAALYGGGLGAGGLGALGGLGGAASSALQGSNNSAVANADMHTNAAAAGLASLRAQSSYVPGAHLERLSDEQLRALSADGRGASAFKPLSNRGEEKSED